jgi:hypothetical protein
MQRLGYTSAEELLAEKFHMSQELLRRLNPGATFDLPESRLWLPMSNAIPCRAK